MYCIVLYCIVLYCIVLCYIVFIVLYCIVLYCIVLYCIVLYCIVYCIVRRSGHVRNVERSHFSSMGLMPTQRLFKFFYGTNRKSTDKAQRVGWMQCNNSTLDALAMSEI